MRRLTIPRRFLILFFLCGLLTLLLSHYGSIHIVINTASQSIVPNRPNALHNLWSSNSDPAVHVADNNVSSNMHSLPGAASFQLQNANSGTAANINNTLFNDAPNAQTGNGEQTQGDPRNVDNTIAHAHCWDLLDDVTIGHVTNEGKTFTDEQLDVTAFKDTEPLIPKILHQTWDTYDIPEAAVPWVQSLLRHHPDWEYWFWTQKDVKCYLNHKHRQYVSLYNSYFSMIFRTDVMRYFLLYDYGGIYLDLDVECLKPLDIWTHLAPAILSHETYDHSFVMHRLQVPNVMTTVLASRAKHPYYKLLQENLSKYHKEKPMDVLHSTGPYYLNDIYNLYVQKRNSSGFKDDVLVIHPKYWLPTNDKMNMSHICSCDLLKNGAFVKNNRERILKNPDVVQLCAIARKKNFSNVPDSQSYLDHHWVHTNIGGSIFKKTATVNMFKIFPDLVPVYKRLGLQC